MSPKDESRKASSSASQPPVKCPRCDSPNTKFCYYNNYSLTQPRHFCKTCRRYWTKGGALRNVPVGGGCRKSKKLKPLHPSTTTTAFHHHFPSLPSPSSALDPSLMGFAFPLKQGDNLASIESLSSINQDLHWKLQQQRLASLFVQDADLKEPSGSIQKPLPIQFHNPNSLIGTKDGSFSNTDCFLNNSYSSPSPAPPNFNAAAGNWSAAWSELSHYTSLP